jgi:hypothetical protein
MPNNNKTKIYKTSSVQILTTVLSLFIINYISNIGLGSTEVLIAFLLFQFLLFLVNPLCAFVFCFVMNTNLMENFTFLWTKPVTVVLSYAVFVLKPRSLSFVFKNKKFKSVFYCALLFSFFVLIFDLGFNNGLSFDIILTHFNIIFGFLIAVPAYYFTIKEPKGLFICLAAIATSFLIIYYTNFLIDLHLFRAKDVEDSRIESNLNRFFGYDLRQFVIFFSYLIPAFILTKKLSKFTRFFIISVGIFAYLVLLIALYRLALFYTFMGAFLSVIYISRYVKSEILIKRAILIAIFLSFGIYFFSDYIVEFQKIIDGTLNYFAGKGEDNSADARAVFQTPILLSYIENNFWIGAGVVEADLNTRSGMFGFVDIPILGSLASFGFVGMTIYYFRFYYILRNKSKFKYRFFNLYDEREKLLFFIFLSIKAYLVTMVTFRIFYISWELAFDWQQAEFGLFVGIYLALEYTFQKRDNYICSNGSIINKIN